MRELGASLLRGFDDKGKVKTGMAFDFAPLVLVAPQTIVGGESYKNNPWLQAATRTTVSLATTEAADGKGSQLAWGLRVGVFDLGDPGRHYKFLTDCVRGLVPTAMPSGPTTGPLSPEAEAKFREDAAKCNPATGLALWAEPALYVGLGQSRLANDGKLSGTVPAVTAWWATYSQGWDRGRGNLRALFQLHFGQRTDDRVNDPSGSSQLIRQDSRQLVTRVRVGKENGMPLPTSASARYAWATTRRRACATPVWVPSSGCWKTFGFNSEPCASLGLPTAQAATW